jgi:uncharacterized protein YegL
MKHDLTEIAFILDRSGSMSSMVEAAISGFNRLLKDQQAAPGEARFSLVLFDDQYEVPCASLPISKVRPLDTRTFVPRGSTALLDAIGRTIDDLGKRLADTPEARRPGSVIIAILTDGYENASVSETWESISKKISHQQEKYAWQFLFLAANVDAIATAGRMNIHSKDAACFAAEPESLAATKDAISRKMRASRAVRAGNASLAETLCADADLGDIVREEERKRGR